MHEDSGKSQNGRACRNPRALFKIAVSQSSYRVRMAISNVELSVLTATVPIENAAPPSGTPTLGLFSNTDSAKYAPYGDANIALHTRGMNATEAATAAAQWFEGVVGRSRFNAATVSGADVPAADVRNSKR